MAQLVDGALAKDLHLLGIDRLVEPRAGCDATGRRCFGSQFVCSSGAILVIAEVEKVWSGLGGACQS